MAGSAGQEKAARAPDRRLGGGRRQRQTPAVPLGGRWLPVGAALTMPKAHSQALGRCW
jgi:hypothetical protein